MQNIMTIRETQREIERTISVKVIVSIICQIFDLKNEAQVRKVFEHGFEDPDLLISTFLQDSIGFLNCTKLAMIEKYSSQFDSMSTRYFFSKVQREYSEYCVDHELLTFRKLIREFTLNHPDYSKYNALFDRASYDENYLFNGKSLFDECVNAVMDDEKWFETLLNMSTIETSAVLSYVMSTSKNVCTYGEYLIPDLSKALSMTFDIYKRSNSFLDEEVECIIDEVSDLGYCSYDMVNLIGESTGSFVMCDYANFALRENYLDDEIEESETNTGFEAIKESKSSWIKAVFGKEYDISNWINENSDRQDEVFQEAYDDLEGESVIYEFSSEFIRKVPLERFFDEVFYLKDSNTAYGFNYFNSHMSYPRIEDDILNLYAVAEYISVLSIISKKEEG